MPGDHPMAPGDGLALIIGRMKKAASGGDGPDGDRKEAQLEAAKGLIDAIHAKDAEAFLEWRDRLASCDPEDDDDDGDEHEGLGEHEGGSGDGDY